MSNSASAQAATLQRFLDAWKKWDAAAMLATFSDDFTQVTLPLALGIPPRPRAEVEAVFPALVATVKSYELTIHNTMHDAERNTAAIYSMSKGNLPWDQPWNMEYSVFLTFSESGDKIVKMEEMMDSCFFKEFAPNFQNYLKANGGPKAVAAGTTV